MTSLLDAAFPDATALWAALAALGGVVSVMIGYASYRLQKRASTPPVPNVNIRLTPSRKTPDVWNARLHLINPLPFGVTCESITLVKPNTGWALVSMDAVGRSNVFGEEEVDDDKLAAHRGQRHIDNVGLEALRAGTSRASGAISDHVAYSFFVRRLRTTADRSSTKMSIRCRLRYHDAENTMIDATVRNIVIPEQAAKNIAK